MFIENATSGSQSIAISQGSGANVTIATGKTAVVYLDGAGSGAAVVDAMAGVDPGVTDTLAEVLVAGNTSGGTGLTMSSGDDLTLTGASYNVVWDSSADSLTFADNAKAVFGAGDDLQIGHDGSVSFITDSGTGDLYIQGSSAIRLTNPAGNETFAVFNDNGAASLYYDNGVSLSTTATGVDITGTLVSDGLTVDGEVFVNNTAGTTTAGYLYSELDNFVIRSYTSDKDIIFKGNDGGSLIEAMRIDMSAGGNVGIGVAPATKFDVMTTGANQWYIRNTDGTAQDNSITSLRSGGYSNIALDGEIVQFKISGSERMRIDASGNVGIGNTIFTSARVSAPHLVVGSGSASPGLTLYGAVNSQGSINFADSTSGTDSYDGSVLYAFGSGSPYMSFHVNGGAERMRIDASGNVGIGCAPSSKLDIDISTNARGYFADNIGEVTSGTFCLQVANSANTVLKPLGFRAEDIRFATGASERMRIDASGNVGIGCTPGYKFEVRTNDTSVTPQQVIRQIGSGDAAIGFQIPSAANWYAGVDNSASDSFVIGRGLAVGTDVAMTLDASGNLLVGVTAVQSFSGVNAAQNFVTPTNGSWAAGFRNTTASTPWGVAIDYTGANPNNNSSDFLYCSAGGLKFSVMSNGGVKNYQANDSNLSDRREKTNFSPAKSYLDAICAIPVQTFNYIDQNMEDDPSVTLGVVAQDVQTVAPELVMESNWGTEEDPKMRLSIYQTDLQYALMKCIQEQQATIEALTARIAALES